MLTVSPSSMPVSYTHLDVYKRQLSAEAITGALTGCRYDRAAVLDALRKNGIDGAVYQISAADMAALIAD